MAPRLGLERGPGELTERPRSKHRHSVNPGNGVREDGGGQTPELSGQDRDIKAGCHVMSLLTMMLIFMSVATGGLVRTEEGQKHRVASAVLCLSRTPRHCSPGYRDINTRLLPPCSGLSSVFTRINHTWTLIIYWNLLPSFIRSS